MANNFPNFQSLGIIGFGRLGALWYELLKAQYSEILRVWAPEKQIPIGQDLESMFSCEYVFLAIPPSALENFLRSALPHLSKHTVLIDCSSVKEYPKKIFNATLGSDQACILTHPLFGPGSYAAQGKTLRGSSLSMEVLHASTEQVAKLKSLFLALELTVHEIPSEDHDRITARTQFVSLCIARLVKELGLGESLLDTPSSRSLVEFAKRVSVDEALLREILRYNQFAQGELRRIEMYFDGLRQSMQKDK